jgi:hypothetical protein
MVKSVTYACLFSAGYREYPFRPMRSLSGYASRFSAASFTSMISPVSASIASKDFLFPLHIKTVLSTTVGDCEIAGEEVSSLANCVRQIGSPGEVSFPVTSPEKDIIEADEELIAA